MSAANPTPSPGYQPRSRATPELSVIIPVYASKPEALAHLGNALDLLNASSFQAFDIIVADDASPCADAVSAIAQKAGARLVRLDLRSGPAAARNAAANIAGGDILVFFDADTSVHPDTLERFSKKFREFPELDAVMGSYDQRPTAPGLVSHFRNLLHSFVHHRASPCASTFWTGCGAVRRGRFRELGGFDPSFPQPSIEDVEFGLRLRDAGGLIHLDPQIQVTHHKLLTLTSMVRTDFFERAIPWALMIHKHPLPFDLNFKTSDRISSVLVSFTLLAAIVAILHGGGWWLAPVVSLAAITALNWPLFRFLAQAVGWREAMRCAPLLLIYLATCVSGLIVGLALAEHRRDRRMWPVAAMIGLALLAVQISGGAFKAEFTGHHDEAAHFVSGLMVYDYLTTLPRQNPVTWVGQYYLHYPEVTIGRWPPGFHVMEAMWWLFLGPSRLTSMLLQWLLGVVTLTVLYRLSRSELSLPITAGIIALTMAAPVFQQSLELTMADLCCLLWSVLVMQATVRLLEQQDQRAWLLVGLWLLAAAFTKGTAVCLAPVPVLALLASGRPIRISPGLLGAGVAGLLVAAAWYFSIGDVQALGGISFGVPWPGRLIGRLAGWGFLALAILGLRRKPLAIVAGSVVACTLSVSLVTRAMQEERHWIIALPAILVLAGFALSRFRRAWVTVCLLLPAAALFPFARYLQPASEFGNLRRQLPPESRILVSSAGWGEGAWIAISSLAERRPDSFVLRASNVLAKAGWNGEGYRLTAATRDAVSRRLDELAVDGVVLHTPAYPEPQPHHSLLQTVVTASPAWRPCGHARDLQAYCRVGVPQLPRQPLRLQILGWEVEERISR